MKPAPTVCNAGGCARNRRVTAGHDDVAMSPLIRNIILGAGFLALILGAARAVASLPQLMHGAGITPPVSWEQVLVQALEDTGQ